MVNSIFLVLKWVMRLNIWNIHYMEVVGPKAQKHTLMVQGDTDSEGKSQPESPKSEGWVEK